MNTKNINQFDFHLPNELIARYPTQKRSASRLLCLNRATGEIKHQHFFDLPNFLKPHDLLVFNNSKVIPARLYGIKETGGQIEILVERILTENQVLAHVRNSKTLKIGSLLYLPNQLTVKVLGKQNDLLLLQFLSPQPVIDILSAIGHIPLPPYINRDDESFDRDRYQTIYAQINGSVAAPTAGLHFDQELITQISNLGVDLGYLTLHVGAGTFKPIKTDDITQHQMHSEVIDVDKELCAQVHTAKTNHGR